MRAVASFRSVLLASAVGMGLAPVVPGGAARAQAPDRPVAGPVEEIIVTGARKRSERLEDVPLAITSFGADDLIQRDIRSINELYTKVPSLYFTRSGGAAPTSDFVYPVIRGVGFNGGQEPATGVFIDGMYQPQLGFDIGFLELERVEVLRGPQGTLFGRNTQGGALVLTTRKPNEELRGRAEVSAGSNNTWRALGAVSGPLGGTVFAGVNAEYTRTDGYISNATTGSDSHADGERYSVSGTLRFVPTPDLEILLSGDISRWEGNEIGTGVLLRNEAYTALDDDVTEDEKQNEGVLLTVNWAVADRVNITSLTGYRSVDSDITIDNDGRPTNRTPIVANGVAGSRVAPGPVSIVGVTQYSGITQDFWSQELRLDASLGDFDILVGGYYFEQEQNQKRDFLIGRIATIPQSAILAGTRINEDFDTLRDGYAGFGQVIWNVTDRFEVTGGIRLSEETVEFTGERLRNITAIENARPTFFRPNAKRTFDDTSLMASVSYRLTDDALVYATYAEGWKAGGFNRSPSTANAVLPYDSETSTNYEAGLKSSFLDDRLTANITAFYIEISGQQLLTVTPDAAGVPVTTIANAGSSESSGLEFELGAMLMEGLQLTAGGGYVDTEYTDFIQRGAGGQTLNRNGQPFEAVPEWTYNAGISYTVTVAGDMELNLRADYAYVDDVRVPDGSFTAPFGAQLQVPSYDRVDLRVSLTTPDGWRFAASVTNLLDSFDYTGIQYDAWLARVPDNFYVIPLPPREFGLTVSKRF